MAKMFSCLITAAALLANLTGSAAAGSLAPLTNEQMDKVTAGADGAALTSNLLMAALQAAAAAQSGAQAQFAAAQAQFAGRISTSVPALSPSGGPPSPSGGNFGGGGFGNAQFAVNMVVQ